MRVRKAILLNILIHYSDHFNYLITFSIYQLFQFTGLILTGYLLASDFDCLFDFAKIEFNHLNFLVFILFEFILFLNSNLFFQDIHFIV